MANVRIYVLDPNLQITPIGVPGELFIAGAGVSRGYLDDPGLTAERFISDPFSDEPGARMYRTGDKARILTDGKIEFLGRLDYQVKVRGFRVELGEVEAALGLLSEVHVCVVTAREMAPGDLRLVAYVVAEDPSEAPTPQQLHQALRTRLPEYMVPSAFVSLDALPLTPNGKIDRESLPAPESDAFGTTDVYVAPRNPIEEFLVRIWSEVLHMPRVGVYDHFFLAGGHSLLATQVMSRVRAELEVEVPLRTLFERPILADLAGAIEDARRTGGGSPIPPLRRYQRDERLPLSSAQERLWFLAQLEPEESKYNTLTSVRIEGQLELSVLSRCFEELFRRHEVLRTAFVTADDQPYQQIIPDVSFSLGQADLTSLARDKRDAEAQRLAIELAIQPYDLSRPPLLRVLVVRLDIDVYLLFMSMHHIVSDGWSGAVFARDVSVLYDALSQDHVPDLPELPVQYADYALWQRSWLDSEFLAAELDWWQQNLDGVPALQLPVARPRPAALSGRGGLLVQELPQDLVARLQHLSGEHRATLFMTLLASFQVLLFRYTGQTDFAVGSPVAGRTRIELESLIGFFVNMLVLRADLSGDPSMVELMARVREVTLDAYARQEVPFDKIVQELQPRRDLSRTPLFQVTFALQNIPEERLSAADLVLKPIDVPAAASRFEMELLVDQQGDQLAVNWVYSTDLFDQATIARMAGHYLLVLEAVADDPTRAISQLPARLLSVEEERTIDAWSGTALELVSPNCLHELFAAQATRTPDRPAVVMDGVELTFRELDRQANRLAHWLRSVGVGAEVRVALCVGRSIEALVGLLAILKAGGAYVPIERDTPEERVRFILRD
ncbi:MAG: condensation domain-containing protein, partial [Myxococcota bacterium]